MQTNEDFEPEPELPEPRVMCFFTQDELAETWRECQAWNYGEDDK